MWRCIMMWIFLTLQLFNVWLVQGKSYFDEKWSERTVEIKIKTDLNFSRKRNTCQFDRTIDCPKVLKVDVDVGVEVVELDLRLNKLLEPEGIPILVAKDNEVTVWSEYQKLPERRRETCYYQDTSHAASVTFEDDFGTFHGKMSGSFTTVTGTYVFEPMKYSSENHSFNPKYRLRKVKYEGPYDVQREEKEVDYVSTIQVEAPVTDFDQREKRSTPIPNYVETLAVIDYALYSRIYEGTDAAKSVTDREAEAMGEIRYQFSQTFNGIDTRYNGISLPEYSYNVVLKGLFVATTAAESPYTENIKQTEAGRDTVDVEQTLLGFNNWTRDREAQFSVYDHMMMFSGYDFRGDAQGLSVTGGICSSQRVSVIEYEGIKVIVQIGAHEMGHNLNAKHDKDTTACSDNDNYIMRTFLVFAGNVGNLRYFSPCSIEAIKNKTDELNQNNENCLLNSSSVFNSTEYRDALTMPPGLRYTRDQQCQAIIGESGSYYYGILSNICTVLQCYRPSTDNIIDYEGRALDLTTCGNHMWCENYQCVANDSAGLVSLDEQCHTTIGNKAAYYSGGHYGLQTVCGALQCFNPGTSSLLQTINTTLDFTSCGNKMWCEDHVCVTNTNAPALQDCQFGDVSKVNPTDNCAQYIAANPSRCNNAIIRQQCCATCASPGCSSETVLEPSATKVDNQPSSADVMSSSSISGGNVQQSMVPNVQPSSTVDTAMPSESPVTTQQPSTGTENTIRLRITFQQNFCHLPNVRNSLATSLQSIHAGTTDILSCTQGCSIVVYVVQNGGPVTEEIRAKTAAEILNAVNDGNGALAVNGASYTMQGNPAILLVSDTGDITEVDVDSGCSYYESRNLCAIDSSCALNENNLPYCVENDSGKKSVMTIILSVCGAIIGILLMSLVLYLLIRYKDTIFPEHKPKRQYIRKTGRRWIHDQQQVPVYQKPYERDMWYHSTPTKYSPSYYSQPMYMTTQTGYSHLRQPFY